MDKKEALNIVAQACVNYKGTYQDHQMIQQALQTLALLVNPAKDAEKAKKSIMKKKEKKLDDINPKS